MTEAYKHTLATTLTQSAHTFHNITFYLHMSSFAGFSKISVNIIAKVIFFRGLGNGCPNSTGFRG